jgi:hypothetical protein
MILILSNDQFLLLSIVSWNMYVELRVLLTSIIIVVIVIVIVIN